MFSNLDPIARGCEGLLLDAGWAEKCWRIVTSMVTVEVLATQLSAPRVTSLSSTYAHRIRCRALTKSIASQSC